MSMEGWREGRGGAGWGGVGVETAGNECFRAWDETIWKEKLVEVELPESWDTGLVHMAGSVHGGVKTLYSDSNELSPP